MRIYIGAENCISPLGSTSEDNFASLSANHSGIKHFKDSRPGKTRVFLSKFNDQRPSTGINALLKRCLSGIMDHVSEDIFASPKTLFILSTTKGDLANGIRGAMIRSVSGLQNDFFLKNTPLIVSNACASGVIAINTAANLIRARAYEQVIVAGCDLISDFVLNGFQSLYAVSGHPCTPFDESRSGITLGEAVAGMVLSHEKSIFRKPPMEYLEGCSSNDATHISGPSRTGEGLFRSVKQTLQQAGRNEKQIDYISAHGTATAYNDDMEATAFGRLGMNDIPLNSFKGYFGHTLGAAGILETAMCIQTMRTGTLIKSLGFNSPGSANKMNVIKENKKARINTVLKTASGFGGCNASLLLQVL